MIKVKNVYRVVYTDESYPAEHFSAVDLQELNMHITALRPGKIVSALNLICELVNTI
jgi:hypothetical protein